MPRHPKPLILIEYENKKRPRICHTCEFYDENGVCLNFAAEPPKEFAETDGACAHYDGSVPF